MVENHGLNSTPLTSLDQVRAAGDTKCDPLDKTDRIELYKGAGLATREDKVGLPSEFGCLKITEDSVEPAEHRVANHKNAFLAKLAIELAKEAAKGAVGAYVVSLLSGPDKKPEEKTATPPKPITYTEPGLSGTSGSSESLPVGSKESPFVQASETNQPVDKQPAKPAAAK
jgi:hypothetical protein